MRREHLQLIEFTSADEAMLQRVGRLRVAAWASELPSDPNQCSWLDGLDRVARHWAFLASGEPVASARMTVHSALEEVPDPEDFTNLFSEPLPSPIASINRLVVGPEYRGLGLGRALDEVRLQAAEEMGCRCVVVSTPSGDRRVAQIVSQGFRLMGCTGAANTPALLRDLPPAVALVRFLSGMPRGA